MDYNAKSTGVKQKDKSSLKSHVSESVTTLSLSILWSVAWVDLKKTGFSCFQTFMKEIAFYSIENLFRRSSLHEI